MIDKKMYKNLRTAVIGVGVMGMHHVRILSEVSNLVGIYDLNKSHSSEVSQKFGTKCYDDLDSLLSEVDAAIIAVPTIYGLQRGRALGQTRIYPVCADLR